MGFDHMTNQIYFTNKIPDVYEDINLVGHMIKSLIRCLYLHRLPKVVSYFLYFHVRPILTFQVWLSTTVDIWNILHFSPKMNYLPVDGF